MHLYSSQFIIKNIIKCIKSEVVQFINTQPVWIFILFFSSLPNRLLIVFRSVLWLGQYEHYKTLWSKPFHRISGCMFGFVVLLNLCSSIKSFESFNTLKNITPRSLCRKEFDNVFKGAFRVSTQLYTPFCVCWTKSYMLYRVDRSSHLQFL